MKEMSDRAEIWTGGVFPCADGKISFCSYYLRSYLNGAKKTGKK